MTSMRATMRIRIDDSTEHIGGGQRWSRDFVSWLRSRGHEVEFCSGPETFKSAGISKADFYFDMGCLGDLGRHQSANVAYLWCHVPASLRHPQFLFPKTEVLASSEWSQSEVSKVWQRPSKVLMPFGRPAVVSKQTPPGDYVLFLGRLTRAKGVFAALDLYERCSHGFKLVIAGATWSTPQDDLQELRRRAATARNVILLEDLSQHDLERLYGSTVAFLQLAGYEKGPPEAFGLAAVDAYMSGIPVLASRQEQSKNGSRRNGGSTQGTRQAS